MSLISRDTLFDGRLICHQSKAGYRFSVDAVLAAHFFTPKSGDTILDLCSGCGVIGLILAYRHPDVIISGLEFQEELVDLGRQNSKINGFQERLSIIQGDACMIKHHIKPEHFDLVVCNPPYRKLETGRINSQDQAAIARHEITAAMCDFVGAASFAVRNRGVVVFIYPATRVGVLIAVLQQNRLMPKRVQPVYSYPGKDSARLVLVEAVKNGGEQCELMTPLYIYESKNGEYSQQMMKLYR